MSGQPGRSGRPRKPLSHHLRRGTYRADRHGPVPSRWPGVPPSPPPPPEPVYDWHPTPEDLARLGPAGRSFVTVASTTHEHNFVSGRLLLEMAGTLDLLRLFDADIDARGIVLIGPRGATTVNPFVRQRLQTLKWLGQMTKQLNLNGPR